MTEAELIEATDFSDIEALAKAAGVPLEALYEHYDDESAEPRYNTNILEHLCSGATPNSAAEKGTGSFCASKRGLPPRWFLSPSSRCLTSPGKPVPVFLGPGLLRSRRRRGGGIPAASRRDSSSRGSAAPSS